MGKEAEPYGPFVATPWSEILKSQGRAPASSTRIACLSELFRAYHTPVYAFVRRRLSNAEDALDLTQDYFTTFLEKNWLDDLSPERGHFRAFLLNSLKNFVRNQAVRRKAAKRGGGAPVLSLDVVEESARGLSAALADSRQSPETAFMREWARIVVERAMRRLRTKAPPDYSSMLERYSAGGEAGRPGPYEAIGRELGWNTEKVRKTLHRARRRFNSMLRETIREYVATDEEVEGELSDLRRHFR